MCRNIKPLFNFEPPATRNEMHDAALQFVRKISGYTHPSKANEAAFEEAVEDIEKVVKRHVEQVDRRVIDRRPRNSVHDVNPKRRVAFVPCHDPVPLSI